MDLLKELTNARGQKTFYEYDKAGRIISYTDTEGTVSYTYDNNGNVLTVTDKKGTITREYDALGRVTKYTNVDGKTISYEYDAAGNLISLTYPDGDKVNYSYDANNQLIKVTDWKNRVTKYEYDEIGNLLSILRSDASLVTRTYDAASNMTSMTDKAADGSIINHYEYEYDEASRLIKETSQADKAEYTIIYDELNRVLKRTKKDLTTGEITEEIFEYDAACNITSSNENGLITLMAYDNNNILTITVTVQNLMLMEI